MITAQEVIDKVRGLVEKSPNNVYDKGELRFCSYSEGTCTDGSRGCLFGQALKELMLDEWGDIKDATINIYSILRYYAEGTEDQLNWCLVVQRSQDKSLTWSEAVELADNLYKI